MDLSTLSHLFASTLNPDPNIRKSSELEIRKISNEEGLIGALLQIIAADSIDLATRQSCSVWLKNRVRAFYDVDPALRRKDQGLIGDSDRSALRANILPLLATSPSRPITTQLATALRFIVAFDYPTKWPNAVSDVKLLLGSNNAKEVHAGCLAALEIVRAYRFRQKADMMPQVVAELFPSLVSIAAKLVQQPITSKDEDIPSMLHLILKTYKTSILVNLSLHQQSVESIVPWGQLLFAVVNLHVPPEAVDEDEEERERSEWWKAKKWAYRTLGRLFHGYGNPSQLPSTKQKEYGPFAQHFVTEFAPAILNIYLHQVELFVSNQAWLSKKCQYLIFSYFTECIKPKSTWSLLKPHFESLVSNFVFPQLSFNASRQALWETDPIDYVRTSINEYENFTNPVSAATSFLFALASNRTKTTFVPILGFINTVLESGAAPPQRFGALNMTAALGPWIMKHPDVSKKMEQFVVQFVTPELTSGEAYLRAIACEVIGTVTKNEISWSTPEVLNVHFEGIFRALDDPEFPVRVHAALALTELVLAHEDVRTAVAPHVGKVIQDLLKLSDEIDQDILNRSMEVMVDCFQTELMPVAAQLTARLCESYVRLARESGSGGGKEDLDTQELSLEMVLAEGDDEKTFAALGVAKTIGTIVTSVDTSPKILAEVQEIIIPIIVFTFDNKLLDLLDVMYDLADNLTYKLRAISPNMWPVFEATYKLFKSDASDFLEEMLPTLDNFVSFGNDVIKGRKDYQQMLLDIYTTSITSEHLGETDRINGCKLAESVLLNLRGHVDDALQPIIATAIGHLNLAKTSSLKLANFEVLINAVLYNPSAALHLMEVIQPGMARVFFDKWFGLINSADERLPRVHDKKLSILTLCALLEMSPATIPETLKEGWPGMVAGALKLFQGLPKAIEDRKALEEALAEESDDDDEMDDEALLNLNDEEDEDVWDEESAYIELLAKEGARLRAKGNKGQEEAEDDSSDDSDIDEEIGYFSAIDNVDPYVSFKQALTSFQMQNGHGYQTATTSLSADLQTLLMEVMHKAEAAGQAVAQS